MPVATLDGITIAYDDSGNAMPPLILIHGHPFDRSMWQPQVAAVAAAGRRVLAPDLRGYGASTVVAGKTTFDRFAADLAALLDHLAIEEIVLAGLSMGGQIAMEFCRSHGTRVRGLVLAATFETAESGDGRQARLAMAERLEAEGMDGYAREVLTKMMAPENVAAMPGIAAAVMAMMRNTDARGAAAALRGRAERPPYGEVLAGLDVPALIVVGDRDAFTTRADAERMHATLADCTLAWIEGAGHLPNLERTDAFNAALFGLLARV